MSDSQQTSGESRLESLGSPASVRPTSPFVKATSNTVESRLDAADNRSGCNQDERLLPSEPKASQQDPEQPLPSTQSSVRSLGVQREQLLAESEVFQDEILMGTASTDHPTEKMPKAQEHGRILSKGLRADRRASD